MKRSEFDCAVETPVRDAASSPLAGRKRKRAQQDELDFVTASGRKLVRKVVHSGEASSLLERLLGDPSLGPELCAFNSGEDLDNLSRTCRTADHAVKHCLALQWRHECFDQRIRVGPTDGLRSVSLHRQTARSMEFLQRLAHLFEMQSSPKQLPDCDYIQKRYSSLSDDHPRFLSPVLRQVLVDWMAEVCTIELEQPLCILHSAVRILDQALGRIRVPPREVLLAACVAILVENHGLVEDQEKAQAGKGDEGSTPCCAKRLSVQDVVYISANQFNGFEICKSYNIIISQCKTPGETPQRTKPTVLDWLALLGSSLSYFEDKGQEKSIGSKNLNVFNRLRSITCWDCGALTTAVEDSERKGLALFLANIALLDYGALKFLPSTTAVAIVILAECTLRYHAATHARSREAKASQRRSAECAPRDTSDSSADSLPASKASACGTPSEAGSNESSDAASTPKTSAAPDKSDGSRSVSPSVTSGLRDFIRSSEEEVESIEKAVWRLWQLQRDYLDLSSIKDSPEKTTDGDPMSGDFADFNRYTNFTRYCRSDLRWQCGPDVFVYNIDDNPVELGRILHPHPHIRGHLRGIEHAFEKDGVNKYIRQWTEKGPARPSFVKQMIQVLLK